MTTTTVPSLTCAESHVPGTRFRFNTGRGPEIKCFRHALTFRPLVRTATITAVVVGTILTAINQGTVLADGDFPQALYWKIPLTYCVPYCVASFSALRMALVRD